MVATSNLYQDVSGQKEQSGTTFSFVDPADFYQYKLDPAEDVAALRACRAVPRAELGHRERGRQRIRVDF